MSDDDLYARHHMLTALVGVLLHDLRNPLHSATLLAEAMSSRSANIESLRTKLRGQLTKLEALISEATHPIKEQTLEPQPCECPLGAPLERAAQLVRSSLPVELAVTGDASVPVVVDPALLARAVFELVFHLDRYRAPDVSQGALLHLPLVLSAAPDHVRVHLVAHVGEIAPSEKSTLRAGLHIALARALCQRAGATLRHAPPVPDPETPGKAQQEFDILVPLASPSPDGT